MFPAPSPNSQALYNSLQSGGATPSTLDFHRTALSAAAANKANPFNITSNGPTSQPADQAGHPGMDHNQFQQHQQPQPGQQDPYGQHETQDAAHVLSSLLANGGRNNNQFAVPGQPAHVMQANMGQMPSHMGMQSQDTSPTMKHGTKGSIGSMTGSADTGDFSESGNSEQAKPSSRSRGKKGSTGKVQTGNGRRKAEETPVKGPANKRSKNNNGMPTDQELQDMMSDDEGSPKQEGESSGKKMTDEEKRKNFLERNRYVSWDARI